MRGGRLLTLPALFLTAACATTLPDAASVGAAPVGGVPIVSKSNDAAIGSAEAAAIGALETMREMDAAAARAFEANHLAEGARHLVAALAVDERAPGEEAEDRRAERAELARKADSILTALEAKLTLEPADAWLQDGAQTAGSTRDLSRGRGRAPSVRLVVNYEAGKAVVADAPIRFAFVDGAGDMTTLVATDEYGLAAATVRSLARADRPAVIRATLVIENRGLAREFPSVVRDFTYLPSSRAARLLAVERRAGAAPSPADASAPLADAVSRGLAATGLTLLPIAAEPPGPAGAEDARAGARRAAAAEADGGWLVVAITEYEEEGRMANRGRSFEIYTVTARTSVRVFGDGGLAAARPALTSVGRGGSAEAALQAALSASRAAAERDLRGAAGEIGKVLN